MVLNYMGVLYFCLIYFTVFDPPIKPKPNKARAYLKHIFKIYFLNPVFPLVKTQNGTIPIYLSINANLRDKLKYTTD